MATKTTATTADQATRDAIHRALPGPNGDLRGPGGVVHDQWATARAVAEAVGKGYSTVTEHLRAMAEAGTVTSTRQGRNTVYRRVGASPKLKATDVTTPRADTVEGSTKDGTRRALAPKPPRRRHGAAPPTVTEPAELAPTKKRRPTVTRDVETVDLPAADVEPVPGEPAAGEMVWMATRRKGLNYHARAAAMEGYTVCGRSMRTGSMVPVAEVRATSPFCPVCKRGVYDVRHSDINAEPAAAPSEPVAVPQPPPAANTPTGGDVGAVVDFMESARPVSAPPAEPVQKARRPRTETKTYAVFGRGKLQDAILTHVQALAPGDATPYQVATALNAYPGAVAYGLGRLVVKGNVRVTSDKPQRYAAV